MIPNGEPSSPHSQGEGSLPIQWKPEVGGIEVATATTAAEFVDALRPSNPHWWIAESPSWIFRGHSHESLRLLPSAWRPDNRLMEICRTEAQRRFDKVRPKQSLKWVWHPLSVSKEVKFGDNDEALARELTIRTTAEYVPLWEFVARCDELGIPIPLSRPGPDPTQDLDWLAGDGKYPLVADEFILNAQDLPATVALAQHHEIPTRFLDWTRNPMAAAFFAVEKLKTPVPEASLVVWALHRGRAEALSVGGISFGAVHVSPKLEIVRTLTRDNPFLARQAGLFTTISASGIYFMQHNGARPDIEMFIRQANPPDVVLRKLVLGHAHAAELAQILRRENISRSTLMPTADNVAQDVRKMLSRAPLPEATADASAGI